MRYVRLTLKYALVALGGWLLLMEFGRRLDPDYWVRTLTPR